MASQWVPGAQSSFEQQNAAQVPPAQVDVPAQNGPFMGSQG